MAGDAIARLYDVDEDSVVFTKLNQSEKYDQGVFTFRARKGKLIDLDQVHESLWATRLSGGTRSGLVSLKVTVVGEVAQSELRVANSDRKLKLAKHDDYDGVLARLRDLPQGSRVRLTGILADYRGRWPTVLRQKPPKTRKILVTDFELLEEPRSVGQ